MDARLRFPYAKVYPPELYCSEGGFRRIRLKISSETIEGREAELSTLHGGEVCAELCEALYFTGERGGGAPSRGRVRGGGIRRGKPLPLKRAPKLGAA